MVDATHQRYLELSARIAGIEYLLKQLLWRDADRFAERTSVPATAAIDEVRRDAASSLQRATFPSMQPASSDHVAAMVAENVERVLAELIEEMNSV